MDKFIVIFKKVMGIVAYFFVVAFLIQLVGSIWELAVHDKTTFDRQKVMDDLVKAILRIPTTIIGVLFVIIGWAVIMPFKLIFSLIGVNLDMDQLGYKDLAAAINEVLAP